MGKHIRLTALVLAVCLLLNTVAPATSAEGSILQEDMIPTTEPQADIQESTGPSEEIADPTEPAPTEVPSEAPAEAAMEIRPNATVRCEADSYVNIRSGPGIGHPVVDRVTNGQRVHVDAETVWIDDLEWGCIGEDRWICMTYVVLDPIIPPVEETEPTEPSEETEPTEPSEDTEPTEPSEEPEPTEPSEETEPTEPSEETEPTEPSEETEPTEPSEETEPTEPSEETEPTEPSEETEPTEPTEEMEPTEPSEGTEPTEPTEDTEPTEPTEETEPTEPSGDVRAEEYALALLEAQSLMRNKSLYWWACMTGHLEKQGSLQPNPSTLSEEENKNDDAEEDTTETEHPPADGGDVPSDAADEIQDAPAETPDAPKENPEAIEAALDTIFLSTSGQVNRLESSPEEQSTPEETLSEETLPEETMPEGALPEETQSEETLPEETLPEETQSEETLPEETLPEETQSEETQPEETLPDEQPEETLPEETASESLEGPSVPTLLSIENYDPEVDRNFVFVPNEENGEKTITLTSSQDLILLSYVKPEEYQNLTIVLQPTGSNEGDRLVIDISKSPENTSYTFAGLGSADFPFMGTLKLADTASGIIIHLNQPLFRYICDSATLGSELFPIINLEPAEDSSASALLAENVRHADGKEASWHIKLMISPEDEPVHLSLPPLLGQLEGGETEGAKVSLEVLESDVEVGDTTAKYKVTDLLTVQNSAFLCRSMGAKSTLNVTLKTYQIPAVKNTVGNTVGNTGGLVATMEAGAELTVNAEGDTVGAIESTATGDAIGTGGLVGVMNEGASVSLTVPGELSLNPINANGDHTGGLAGFMADSASLTLNAFSLSLGTVTSASGNAGGLVGTMKKDNTLAVNLGEGAVLSISDVKAAQYVGGLVGEAESPSFTLPQISSNENVTITSTEYSAGGLIGYFRIAPGDEGKAFPDHIEIDKLTVDAKASSGGLFGLLENLGGKYTISSVISDVTFSSKTSASEGKVGGLIGTYTASKLADALILDDNTTTSTLEKEISNYGGLIGHVLENGNPAYIQILSGTVNTIAKQKPDVYGGLIAELGSAGSLVQVGATPTEGGTVSGSLRLNPSIDASGTNKFHAKSVMGGLVGRMPAGVIYLSIQPAFAADITIDAPIYKRGWILGERGNNTLVYTTASGWNADKGQETNDTGLWGQVLRVDGSELSGLLALDEKNHTVKVTVTDKDLLLTDKYQVGSTKGFAALALGLQMNQVTGSSLTLATDPADGSKLEIVLNSDINLEDTGLACITRDQYQGKDTDKASVFSFTITGNNHTITLPSIKVYAADNAHNRQGLIGKAADLTVNDLTLTSNAPYHLYVLNGIRETVNAGMLAAHTIGKVELTNVTSSVQQKVSSTKMGSQAFWPNVSGILGYVYGGNTINFKGCTWGGKIEDICEGSTYIGGYIAFVNGGNRTINVKDCKITGATIDKTAQNIKKNSDTNYTPIGAFSGSLYHNTTTLNIDGLAVKDTKVTVTGETTLCGGLLAWEWWSTNATVKNLTIEGCSLDIGANAEFGGLIYKGTKKCQLGDGDTDGITFKGTNTITGYSNNSNPSGLIFGRGDSGLYLEVHKNGFKIESNPETKTCAVTLNLLGGNYFDELVGRSINSSGLGGIVSLPTSTDENGNRRPVDVDRHTTYRNQLSIVYDNPQTRYYYNLDQFRTKDGGEINTPEEMVLLSAWGNSANAIRSYFLKKAPTVITGNIDLIGYSYYPIPCRIKTDDGNASTPSTYLTVPIENATITFDFETLNTVKNAAGNSVSLDEEKDYKKPENNKRQHYDMHAGIYSSAVNSDNPNHVAPHTQPLDVTVDKLTLRGTVGKSAIIVGSAEGAGGRSATLMTNLKCSDITLDGIRSCRSDYPLLIKSIGSYTSLTMDGVQTTATYSKGAKAATSLIGTVGQYDNEGNPTGGVHIRLSFANIALDGSTNGTIFTKALFIEKLCYDDGTTCKGEYNFENLTPATLGQELSNSGDMHGRNNDEQFWFFKHPGEDNYLVCKAVSESATTDFFLTGYQRYVYNREGYDYTDKTSYSRYHELDINQAKVPITTGCGTYSDPYIISSGAQLIALADALAGGGINDDWEICLNKAVLKGGSFAGQDGHNREAATQDLEECYVCNNGTWYRSQDGIPINNTDTVPTDTVLQYLRNAYYYIDRDISLGKRWAGLGTASDTGAFSGVIVGDGETKVYISPGADPVTQYGGLIKFSLGSVVKNVTIEYKESPKIKSDAAPTNTGDASFFGGVVGWCIGGDTILDNVRVSFGESNDKQPQVTGGTPYLAAVGGYVGLVGGYALTDRQVEYGGGVVFRTAVGSGLPEGTDNYFYRNPYVGRVLDGYALGEGINVENSDKNYKIPNISTGIHLTKADTLLTVHDAQGLWLLSAIVNSGVGCMGNSTESKAYHLGKPRTAAYDSIGMANPDPTKLADEGCWGGAGATKTSAYLTTLADGDVSTLTGGNVFYQIVLAGECNMSSYGNGFRGIGGSYAARGYNQRVLGITSLKGSRITLAQNRKEYTQEKNSWTSLGSGLFTQLCLDTTATIQDLTFGGSTGITYYNGTASAGNDDIVNSIGPSTNANPTPRLGQVGSGMLAGSLAKSGLTQHLTIRNVRLSGASVNNNSSAVSAYAGGLIGLLWSQDNDRIDAITLENCGYSDLTVYGFVDAGGLLGFVRTNQAPSTTAVYPVINMTGNTASSGGAIRTVSTTYGSNYFGCGGLMGCTDGYGLNIDSVTLSDLNVTVGFTGTSTDKSHGGGLVGLCHAPTVCIVKNIALDGTISGSGDASQRITALGGAFGGIVNTLNSERWDDSGSCSLTMSNIRIPALTLQRGKQVGGLIGLLKVGGSVRIQDVTIGSEASSTSPTSPSVILANFRNDSTWSLAGGLIARASAVSDMRLSDISILGTHILLDNNASAQRGAALLLGYAENSSGVNANIDLKNITLRNGLLATTSSDTASGFLYGYLSNWISSSPSITGSNILIQSCQIGYCDVLRNDVNLSEYSAPALTNTGTASGMIGGQCDDNHTTVKLVGVSLKDNFGPAREFGSNGPKAGSYVIRADYFADQRNKTGAAAPHVTVNPKQTMQGITLNGPNGAPIANALTGDGASFVPGDTSDDPMSVAKQILHDRAYGNVPTPVLDYFNECTTALSSYSKSGDNGTTAEGEAPGTVSENPGSTPPDFPVLEIDTNNSAAVTKRIAYYIALLTNHVPYTETDGIVKLPTNSDILSISTPVTYKWNAEDKCFEQQAKSSLEFLNGSFYVVRDQYDNENNQFTLVDVSYKDPADSGAVYHLYIPIIVKKVLYFKFWAAAQLGTNYWPSAYDSASTSVVGSHGEKVTVLIGFEYQRTPEEWQAAINNGDNMLWNFDKKVRISTMTVGSTLPTGTYLTLVDRNNHDKPFFTTVGTDSVLSDGQITFSQFPSWNQTDVPICDGLDLTAQNVENGTLVKTSADDPNATVRARLESGATLEYFRPATAEDSPDERYTIHVGITEKLCEQYYLTIQTPARQPFTGIAFECNNKLSLSGSDGLATQRMDNVDGSTRRKYTRKGSENTLILADFFTQAFTLRADYPSLVSFGSNSITATLNTTLRFTSDEMRGLYGTYADGQQMWQSFEVYLIQKDGSKQTPANFVSGTQLEYFYPPYPDTDPSGQQGPSGSFSLAAGQRSFRINAKPIVVSKDSTDISQEVRIKLTYTNDGLVEQFPVDPDETGNIGILICGNSDWAYSEEALEYSGLHMPANYSENEPCYHRNQDSRVTLTYNANKTLGQSQEMGLSKLGINGLEKGSFDIDSAGFYDVSSLTGAAKARYLRCSLTLSPKNPTSVNGVNYPETVDMANYLQQALISARFTDTSGQSTNAKVVTVENGGVLTPTNDVHKNILSSDVIFALPSFNKDIPIQIPIDLTVITGTAFESKNLPYANYKVALTVELLDKDGNSIPYSSATDYIIYTNAKILAYKVP